MSYTIAGQVIKNEYLALGTFFATGAIYKFASGGSSSAPAAVTKPVPIAEDKTVSAQSKDELDFIQQFVAAAEKEEKGGH